MKSLSLTSEWQRPDAYGPLPLTQGEGGAGSSRRGDPERLTQGEGGAGGSDSGEPERLPLTHQGEGGSSSSSSSDSGEPEAGPAFPWLPLLLYRAHYKVQAHYQQAESGRLGSSVGPEEAPSLAGQIPDLRPDQSIENERGCCSSTAGPADEAIRGPQQTAGSSSPLRWPEGSPVRQEGSPVRQEGSSPLQPANGDLLTELWRGALGSLGEQDKVVYITDWHGELCPPLGGAMWSKYYRHYRRTPENVELAEWVAQRYSKRRRDINTQGSISSEE